MAVRPEHRKIKVLLLLHELSLSGAPKSILDAFETFQEQLDLRIVAVEGGLLETRSRKLAHTQLLHPSQRVPFSLPLGRHARGRLISGSVKKWKPELVYANSLWSLPLWQWVEMPNAPILLHVHELDLAFDLFARKHQFDFQKINRFIAVSAPVRDLLIARYHIPAERITVISASVRDADFHHLPQRVRNEAFVVGGAGKPEWRKGTTLWLQMAAELKKKMRPRPLRFVWVGVGDSEEAIQFRLEARKHGLLDEVDFVPPTMTPFERFAQFDVFAMTSWEDPCPAVVLENMMLKVPVVCFSGSGGAPSLVEKTGKVVDEFCPVAMACAIAELAADRDHRLDLGQEARKRVGQHFLGSLQVPKIWNEIQATSTSHRQ